MVGQFKYIKLFTHYLMTCHMAKAPEIGTSSIKKCLLLGISIRLESFLKQRRWKGLTETNSGIYSFI